jgi:hypothetical protein
MIFKGLQYTVDQFEHIDEVLRIRGWVFADDDEIAHVSLATTSVQIELDFGRPSPDVANVFPAAGSRATAARFETDRHTGRLSVDAFAAPSLRVSLARGGVVSIPIASPSTQHAAGDDAGRGLYLEFVEMLTALPAGRCLEVGSRARSGVVRRGLVPSAWDYIGLDALAGENVQVVGDAHKLSTYFEPNTFDAVMAFSVLEHILMPWKFALELNGVMKRGAIAFFQTHQMYPLHDPPCDYWRFSSDTWPALFNAKTGFEIVAAAMGERAFIGVSDFPADKRSPGYLLSNVLIRKIGATSLTWDVDAGELTRTPTYVDA